MGLNTDRLARLLESAGFRVVARPGRFREEVNLEVWLGETRVAVIKAFAGRPPHVAPWAEVFNVHPGVVGRPEEEAIYRAVAEAVPCGATVFVEYASDRETSTSLMRGVEPRGTRLGALLESLGLRVVRDWYFPEGWLEGLPKLQAEKVC